MKEPRSFWLISCGLLLWALAYCGLVYFSFTSSSPETLQTLVESGVIKPDYAAYILAIPDWVRVITVVLAASRLAGAIALLLRQAWALSVYIVALGLTLVIMYRGFFIGGVAEVIRPSQILVEIGFILISCFAVWFAYQRRKRLHR